MGLITSILDALGVNSTVWILLAIFLVTFLIMDQLVFKPYAKALRSREAAVEGSNQDTEKIEQETERLKKVYQNKVKQVQEEMGLIVNKVQKEVDQDRVKIFDSAEKRSKEIYNSGVEGIRKEVELARVSFEAEVNKISKVLETKVMQGGNS